jgi:uncharacterized circularly permuted ATP-grasp superfamily protein/uncharacterized alpha-E superfamily protein
LAERLVEARRLLRENGITYATGDGPGDARPWEVDAFPLVIAADDWAQLAAGVAQRARLLDAILRDVYLREQLLPARTLAPELVFANPGYLRPCQGQHVPHDCFLHLYAVDVVRGPDGRWGVVTDWTDAPTGLGHALETRLVLARMFPGMIRECRIDRLAPFFVTLQQTLRSLAPAHRENPRIVLLSEGADSVQRFEDTYLARYLNFMLVESGDLAVRDEKVVLKTLGGLLPVDVIWRRMSDRVCDPLELPGDTSRGVPGLLQAVRASHVSVVNALGSSLVQAPALLPYLPALCQRLLRESLRLASVETFWSGTPLGQQTLLAAQGGLMFRAAFGAAGQCEVSPGDGRHEPNHVAELLRRDPYGLVAQQPPLSSTAPVKTSREHIVSAPLALRLFAVWSGTGYQVLPGGLARGLLPPVESGGAAARVTTRKDVWVVAAAEISDVSLLQSPHERITLRRGGAELPSRVADDMFWLGRYVERTDSAARMLRSLVARLAAETERASSPWLAPLLRTLVTEEHLPRELVTPDGNHLRTESEAAVALAILCVDTPQAGFLSCVDALSTTADRVRDRLSPDSWSLLHHLRGEYHAARGQRVDTLADLLTLFGNTIAALAAFGGLAAESMTRTQGWRFMELGRRLERALHTLVLVQNFLISNAGQSPTLLEMLLEVGDGLMTYRSRYLAQLRLAPVLDLLLTDETNPRSVAYQLAAIAQDVAHLPPSDAPALLSDEERLALNMLNSVRQVDLDMLEQAGQRSDRNRLERLLSRLTDQLPRLSDLVSHKYFVHAGSPRQLAEWHLHDRP